ncbi:MAG: Glutamate--cysteine ligase EgtA [Myxococcota bacterium]|nr:Glutamate--cysteine ligase EgtA [Myxococcota bacterium]
MSLDRNTSDAPLLDTAQCVEALRAAEKPLKGRLVGTEHEKFGVIRDPLQPIPYNGAQSIRNLFFHLSDRFGWSPVEEDGNVIALQRGAASISLEPGGQFELSGAPLKSLHETVQEVATHFEELREISHELGLAWLPLGIHPFWTPEQVHWVPKKRYGLMRDYLPRKGGQGHVMMACTCTIQANFDWTSEQDFIEMMRLAMAISPLVTAIFANSRLYAGETTGYASRRMATWDDLDPDRCGFLDWLWNDDFGYRRYVEYALDVPMLFVLRNGEYKSSGGVTFREFQRAGFQGARATMGDWNTHLTTLFPDVRAKSYIEVRTADMNAVPFITALPALWKGVFYSPAGREAAMRLVRDYRPDQLRELRTVCIRDGLQGRFGDHKILDMAKDLLRAAGLGLNRQFDSPGESLYLEPLQMVLAREFSPGEETARRWQDEWGRDPAKLVEALSIFPAGE